MRENKQKVNIKLRNEKTKLYIYLKNVIVK